MRYLLLLLVLFASCETHSFESDRRQLIAKDEIRRKLHRPRGFDVTGFRQDTIESYPDSTFRHPLRYGLDFVYTDSSGTVQKKKGLVIFTPDGKSVINSQIVNRD